MLLHQCDGTHEHTAFKGAVAGTGLDKTKYAENNPEELCKKLADAIMAPERNDVCYYTAGDIMMEDEEQTATLPSEDPQHSKDIYEHRKLKQECGANIVRYVERLHRNLGHPRPDVVVKMLQSANATSEVIECARRYRCAVCLARRRPNQPPKSSALKETAFNGTVQMDFFKVGLRSGSCVVAHMIDQASRFQAARVTSGETTEDAIHALEREWVRTFGAPKRLKADEGRGFCSQAFIEWTDLHGIQFVPSPGEAHNRIGAVERAHDVLREALEVYLDTEQIVRTIENVKEALGYVVPQVNRLMHHKGFSPAQWVITWLRPYVVCWSLRRRLQCARAGEHSC